MPLPFLIPAIISGLSALGGALGNRKSTTEQKTDNTTTSSGTQSGSFNTESNPVLSEIQNYLQNFLFSKYVNQANEDPNLTGYTNEGLGTINRGADIQKQILEQSLARRGLSSSPVGFAGRMQGESNRVGAGVNFLNQIPLLRRQLVNENLTNTTGFLKSLPYGTSTSGTTNQTTSGTSRTVGTGSVTQPGNILGGAIGGGGSSLLATLFGMGAFNKKPNTGDL